MKKAPGSDVHRRTEMQQAWRRLRLAGHPTGIALAGFAVSLIYLFRQLGSADQATLSVWLSSDTLWLVHVFTDVFVDHYSLSGWYFSIAPCWFPDVFVTGLFWAVTGNVILATLFAGFIQIPLLAGAFQLFRRAVGIRASTIQDTFVLATGAAVTLSVAAYPGSRYPGLYQFFLPQTHVGSLLTVLYALGLALLSVRRRRESNRAPRAVLIAYSVLCLLGGMSNLLFFVHMLVPLSASLCFAAFFGMLAVRDCYAPVISGWLMASLGGVLNRVLFHATDVTAQAGVSFDRVIISVDVFVRGAATKILAGDPLHMIGIAWLLVCVGYVLYTLRTLVVQPRDQGFSSQVMASLFLLSCLLSSVCSVAVIILGGSNGLAVFKDYVWSMHYMHPAFLLPIFGLTLVLAWGISLVCAEGTLHWIAMLVAMIAALAPTYKIATSPSPKRAIYAYTPPLVQFMDDLAPGHGLRYGYAGYWQARQITLLSKRGLRAYAVDGMLNPLLWVSNRQWYFAALEDRTKRPPVDFVILDDPLWKISREAVVRVLGQPHREVSFDKTRVMIYAGRHLRKVVVEPSGNGP